MSLFVIVSVFSVILQGMPPTVEYVSSSGGNIDGLSLSNPQCLAVNPVREEFLVADALNSRIVIFDTLGIAVYAFPLRGGRINPFGIAVNSRGEILVGSMDLPKLWVFAYSGVFVGMIDLPDSVLPGALLYSGDDEILVVDRAGRGIIKIDGNGKILNALRSDDINCKPLSIFSDNNGNIAMISYAGTVITGFGRDGSVIYSKGEHGRRPEDFSHPTAAAADGQGWLWVIDSFRHHIKRFDSEGNFVDIFGQRGVNTGEFYFPVDIKITPSGKLAVLEKGPGRLQIFRLLYDEDKR